jgi:hypothetical protein
MLSFAAAMRSAGDCLRCHWQCPSDGPAIQSWVCDARFGRDARPAVGLPSRAGRERPCLPRWPCQGPLVRGSPCRGRVRFRARPRGAWIRVVLPAEQALLALRRRHARAGPARPGPATAARSALAIAAIRAPRAQPGWNLTSSCRRGTVTCQRHSATVGTEGVAMASSSQPDLTRTIPLARSR